MYYSRLVFAEFIRRYGEKVNSPCFYSIRGNCMKGVLRHLGVTPKYFAAFLLAACFVVVRNRKEGSEVRWQNDVFRDEFMNAAEFGLRGPADKPNAGPSEYLQCQVLRDALKEHDGVVDPKGAKIFVYVIRMGKYTDSERIDPAVEINRGAPPPPFIPSIRSLQRWFTLQSIYLVAPFLKDERLLAVQRWLEMEELREQSRPRPSPTMSPTQTLVGNSTVTPSPEKTAKEERDDDSDDDFFSVTMICLGGDSKTMTFLQKRCSMEMIALGRHTL